MRGGKRKGRDASRAVGVPELGSMSCFISCWLAASRPHGLARIIVLYLALASVEKQASLASSLREKKPRLDIARLRVLGQSSP